MILSSGKSFTYVVTKRGQSIAISQVEQISALHVYRASSFNLLYIPLVSRTALPCQSIHDVSRYFCPSGHAHLDLRISFSDLLRETCLYPGSSELLSKGFGKPSFPQNCLLSTKLNSTKIRQVEYSSKKKNELILSRKDF